MNAPTRTLLARRYPSHFSLDVPFMGNYTTIHEDVPTAWIGILEALCDALNEADFKEALVVGSDVGRLILLYDGGQPPEMPRHPFTVGALAFAQAISERVCEVCGMPGQRCNGAHRQHKDDIGIHTLCWKHSVHQGATWTLEPMVEQPGNCRVSVPSGWRAIAESLLVLTNDDPKINLRTIHMDAFDDLVIKANDYIEAVEFYGMRAVAKGIAKRMNPLNGALHAETPEV